MKNPDRPSGADVIRQARILPVAERCFIANGFDGCSVDAIAAEVGVSKRDIYRCYPSKAALFAAVVDNVFKKSARGTITVPARHTAGVRKTLLQFARALLKAFVDEDNLGLFRAIIGTCRHLPQLAATLQQIRTTRSEPVATYFRELAERGEIAVHDPAFAAIRFGSIAIAGSRYLLGARLPSLREQEQLAEAAVDFYLGGYLALPPNSGRSVNRQAASLLATRPLRGGEAGRLGPARFADLIACALDQFLAHGYRGVRLDQVARTAGVGKATLYRQFGDKEGLFRYVVQAQIFAISQTSVLEPAASDDLETSLAALARETLDRHVRPENLALQRLMIEEAPTFRDLAQRLHNALIAVTTRNLRSVLLVHGCPPAGGRAAVAFHTLATLGTRLVVTSEAPRIADRDFLSRETARIFLRGLSVSRERATHVHKDSLRSRMVRKPSRIVPHRTAVDR